MQAFQALALGDQGAGFPGIGIGRSRCRLSRHWHWEIKVQAFQALALGDQGAGFPGIGIGRSRCRLSRHWHWEIKVQAFQALALGDQGAGFPGIGIGRSRCRLSRHSQLRCVFSSWKNFVWVTCNYSYDRKLDLLMACKTPDDLALGGTGWADHPNSILIPLALFYVVSQQTLQYLKVSPKFLNFQSYHLLIVVIYFLNSTKVP